MPEKITQELGFDAGSSIQTIGKINSALSRMNTRLNKIAKSAEAFNNSMAKSGDAVGKFGRDTEQNINKGAEATKRLGRDGSRNVRKFTVTFETLVRVVQTQVIVRAIAAIQRSLSESVGAAVNFQNAVGEISTISTEKNFNSLTDSVTRLSNEFNSPALQTAGALYQTLSSQVAGTFQQQEKFVASVLRFSKVAVVDAANAGRLVTGVINGYGFAVEEADRVTAKLFKTIELGQTNGRELASSLGTAVPIAKQLGIQFDELLASVDDLTLSGVNTAKAITQIRGIMIQLIKPSDDMKRVLRELGFESGQAAIQALGFQGALKAVVQQVGGTVDGIATIFRNQRGLTGALRIATDANSQYATSLEQIQNVSITEIADEFERFTSTDAFTLTSELNEIKNIFRESFGNQVLKGASALSEMKTALEDLGTILGGTIRVLSLGAGGFLEFAKAALETEGIFSKINVLFKALRGEELDSGQKKLLKQIEEQVVETGKKAVKAADERLNAELKANREITRSQSKLVADIRAGLFQRKDDVREAVNDMVEAEKSGVKKILGFQEELVSALSGRLQQLRDQIEESKNIQQDILQEREDAQFESKVSGLSDTGEVKARLRRVRKISAEAARDLAKAREKEDQKAARDRFQKAKDELKKIRQLNESSDRPGFLSGDIDSVSQLVSRRRFQAEADLQETIAKNVELYKEQRDAAKGVFQQEEKLRDIIEKNQGRFGADGRLLSKTELKKRAKRRADAQRELQRLNIQEVQRAESLGFDDLAQKFADSLSNKEITAIRVSSKARKQLAKDVQDVLNQEFKLDAFEERAAELRTEREALAKERALAEARTDENKAEREAIADIARKGISENQKVREEGNQGASVNFERGLVELGLANDSTLDPDKQGRLDAITRSGDKGFTNAGLDAADQLFRDAKALSEKPFFTRFDIRQLEERLETVSESGGKFIKDQVKTLEDAIERLKTIQENKFPNRDSGFDPRFGGQKQGELGRRTTEQEQRQRELFDEFLKAPDKVRPVKDSVKELGNNALNTATKIDVLNAKLRDEGIQPEGVNTQSRLNGGLINYLNEGGLSRGKDRQPAMLAAGESVFSAQATRSFFSQLQATNAMQRPSTVNPRGNTYYGDTSITINESARPGQTGREVDQSLRRARRRGTV